LENPPVRQHEARGKAMVMADKANPISDQKPDGKSDPKPGSRSGAKPKWLRISLATLHVGWIALRTFWLIIWTGYQIALGAALVALVYGVFKFGEYFYVWEIRQLIRENPKSTAFIDAERARLSDSLKTAGLPVPDTLVRWSWIPLDSIPRAVKEAALIAEDAKFYEHQGFDLEQIEFAIVANHQAGKKARGASTITQQVAKNLYLSREKEMSRKLREAAITLELEHFVPKDRILETYLNVAQFADGVFGVREGARYWMHKEPRELSQEEAINLVCLLPSPTKWNPKKPNAAFMQHKRLVVRNYAAYRGLLRQDADTTRMAARDTALARLAEQLSDERWKNLRTRPLMDSGTEGDADSAKLPGEGDATARARALLNRNTF
jgi:monofunctional glycosyltransferase